MPFKSQAQRRKFAQLLVEGKISPETFEEWNRETGSAKLPDHVRKTKVTKGSKKTKTTRTKAKRTTAKRAKPKRAGAKKTARRR